MASKLVYDRERLLAIRATITDFGISEEQQRTLAVIEDSTTDNYSAAPSAHASGGATSSTKKGSSAGGITSRTAAAAAAAAPVDPIASRFSSDKRWDSAKGDGKAPRDTGRSSWRGGRDKETFEEGYLYELKQTAKHKQVLQSAVAEIERETEVKRLQDEGRKLEALKKKIDDAKSAVAAGEPGTKVQPTSATLTPVDGDQPEGDAEATSVGKKHSRFFGGSSESAAAAATPMNDMPERRAAAHHDPVVDFMAPSSNVVWNHKAAVPAAPLTVNPLPHPAPQASSTSLASLVIAGEEKSVATNPTAAPVNLVSKITVGAAPPSSKQKGAQRVWSAADLEQQLMGQSSHKPQPLIGQPTTNLGVFDASQLEHQLLAKTAPSSNMKAAAAAAAAATASNTLGQTPVKPLPTAPANAVTGISGITSVSSRPAQQQPPPVPSVLPAPAFGAQLSGAPQGGAGFAMLSAPAAAGGGGATAHAQPQLGSPAGASPQFLIASTEQQQQQIARYLQSIGHQLPPSGGVVQLTAQQLAQLGAVPPGHSAGGAGSVPLGVAHQQPFAIKLPQGGGMQAVAGGYPHPHAHAGVPQQVPSQQQGTQGNWIVQQPTVSQAVGGATSVPQQLSPFHANPNHYHAQQHAYQQFHASTQAQSVARMASAPVAFPAQGHVMQQVALPTAPRPPVVSVGGSATAPHLAVPPAMLYASGQQQQQQPMNIPFKGHATPNR